MKRRGPLRVHVSRVKRLMKNDPHVCSSVFACKALKVLFEFFLKEALCEPQLSLIDVELTL